MKIRILVVDDEAIARKGLTKIIERENPEWTVIGQMPDGKSALKFMKTEIPDVLITDIRMAGMDGISLSKTVKEKYPDMLIIVVSGYGEFEYAREAVQFGALDYLLKPTSTKAVTRVLGRAEKILKTRRDRIVEDLISEKRGVDREEETEPKITNAVIEDAVTYMRQHFQNELTTREMAEILHLNNNYFCDCFKKETGYTFLEYLTMIRMNAAKKILAQKINVKTAEAAAMVGYADSRYFCRVFKNTTGMTPTEYKEKVRQTPPVS